MKKLGTLVILIFLSTIVAGIYGIIHDQFTFTISSEYFTVYKFDQFNFTDWGNNSPRLTTALIGFLATWWVGLIIGIFQATVGLIHKSSRLMFKMVLNAIGITLVTAVLFALVGGVVGYFNTMGEFECCFPYDIIERRNFRIVGYIHNFSYFGGEIGCVIGLAYQIWKRKAVA